MDSKDFLLLVSLFENARQSYRALGRSVSLSAPVVQERLTGLAERGVLRGYMLSVDPSVFDRDDLIIFFDGDYTDLDARRALAAPDVAWVSRKVDGGLSVGVWCRDSGGAIEEVKAALGRTPSGNAFTERRKRRPLSLMDLYIIDALIDQPRMPLSELARLTRLSPKTVRKHLELLIREKTIFIEPKLGTLAESVELAYQLAVFGRVNMSELRKVLGQAFLVNELEEPPAKSLLCLASNLGEVTNRTRSVEKLPGVESIRLTLNREMLVRKEFVHSLVRKRIESVIQRR
jgi:DNA-binding Lrp family transcriptional regulator